MDGPQAEYARIPWAANTLIPLPGNVSDDDAILLSDIFPTAWFGAELAGIRRGDTVAVYGAGIVGQLAIAAAYRQGAGRVWAVDGVQTRLVKALEQNAEVIDFNTEDPVEAIMDATMGVGVDAVIEAVGVDAQRPDRGPAAEKYAAQAERSDAEVARTAPETNVRGENWIPGNAPPLLDLVAAGLFDPAPFVTQHEPIDNVVDAYLSFDRRDEGWLETVLTTG